MFLKLIIFLWRVYKNINSKKGIFNKVIKANIILYLIKFLELVRKVGIRNTIRVIYYSISAFNFIVSILIILSFTEINWGGIPYSLIEIIYNSLIMFIPIIVMELISEHLGYYIYNIVDYFKNLIKKVVDWATQPSIPNKKPKGKPKYRIPEPMMESRIPGPFISPQGLPVDYSYSDLDISYDYLEDKPISKTKVFIAILIAVGISYYYLPEYYNSSFTWIKHFITSKFSGNTNGGDSSGSSSNSNTSTNPTFIDFSKYKLNTSSIQAEVPSVIDKGKGLLNSPSYYLPDTPMENLKERMEMVLYSDMPTPVKKLALKNMFNHVEDKFSGPQLTQASVDFFNIMDSITKAPVIFPVPAPAPAPVIIPAPSSPPMDYPRLDPWPEVESNIPGSFNSNIYPKNNPAIIELDNSNLDTPKASNINLPK